MTDLGAQSEIRRALGLPHIMLKDKDALCAQCDARLCGKWVIKYGHAYYCSERCLEEWRKWIRTQSSSGF